MNAQVHMTDTRATAERMGEAADGFLASLGGDQRAKAVLDFANQDKRIEWYYTPVPREGLPLSDQLVVQADMPLVKGGRFSLQIRLPGEHRVESALPNAPVLGSFGPGKDFLVGLEPLVDVIRQQPLGPDMRLGVCPDLETEFWIFDQLAQICVPFLVRRGQETIHAWGDHALVGCDATEDRREA